MIRGGSIGKASLTCSRLNRREQDVLPTSVRTPFTNGDGLKALGAIGQGVLDLAFGAESIVGKPVIVAEENGLGNE
jgi:hypothetical protein